MKKIIYSVLVSLFFLQGVQAQQSDFSIKIKPGKDVPKTAKVFVRYFVDRQLVLDSLVFNGKVKTYEGKLDKATLVNLYYSPEGTSFFGGQRLKRLDKVDMYVDKGITQVKFNKDIATAQIKGAAIQKDFAHYAAYMKAVDIKQDQLSAQRSELFKDRDQKQAEIAQLNYTFQELDKEKDKLKESYIKANPNSYFSLLALTELAGYDIDTEYIEPLLLVLSAEMQVSAEGQQLASDIAITKRVGI